MKRTFPVNINGKVFYIDEDAYKLMHDYLSQLRASLLSDDGGEIINDIEERISELFDERIQAGANAITYDDVNNIIKIIGSPDEIGDGEDRQEPAGRNDGESGNVSGGESVKKRLYRNLNDKVFGGVIGGLATYLGWDANIMRLLYIILALFTYFWPLTLVYLIAWMVIPPANTPRRILEMQGSPVNVGTIGKTILNSATPPPYYDSVVINENGFWNTGIKILGKCIIGLFGLAGCVAALIATGVLLFFITALVTYLVFHDVTLVNAVFYCGHNCNYLIPVLRIICMIFSALAVIVPAIIFAWTSASVIFRIKNVPKNFILTAVFLEIILITIAIIVFMYANNLH